MKKTITGQVCSFTGHRLHTLKLPQDENGTAIHALKSAMEVEIDRLITNFGVTRFISGLAIGADCWGCEMVLERIKTNPALELEVDIPFIGQTEKWTNKRLAVYKERCENILKSDKVTQRYTPDAEYIKDSSYQRRNLYLVEQCNFLIAVWNGSGSGTGMTVKMAKAQNKECIIINPLDFKA